MTVRTITRLDTVITPAAGLAERPVLPVFASQDGS
jgi:hypothetical protein